MKSLFWMTVFVVGVSVLHTVYPDLAFFIAGVFVVYAIHDVCN